MPIVMTWNEESAPALLNKVFFPLSFVARANEFISLVKFSKAYSRFIQHKEEVSVITKKEMLMKREIYDSLVRWNHESMGSRRCTTL